MPKVIINNTKGLYQTSGNGVEALSEGLIGSKFSAATSLINVGANDTEFQIVQPANSILMDVGVMLTAAIVGTSGDINVKVGTSDNGNELCAAAALMAAATAAAIGSGISIVHSSEGAANLAFAADSPQYSAAARTVYIRAVASAAITGGTAVAYIKYMVIPS